MQQRTIRLARAQVDYIETIREREGFEDFSSALRYIITLSKATDEAVERARALIVTGEV